MKPKITEQHVRFGLIGILNTATDFVIYGLLIAAGLVPLAANIISTSCAMIVSFSFNRQFTFRAGGQAYTKQAIKFLPITMVGQWILQPIIIYLVRDEGSRLSHVSSKSFTLNLVAKLVAISGTLVWNYVWYSRVVFPVKNEQEATEG